MTRAGQYPLEEEIVLVAGVEGLEVQAIERSKVLQPLTGQTGQKGFQNVSCELVLMPRERSLRTHAPVLDDGKVVGFEVINAVDEAQVIAAANLHHRQYHLSSRIVLEEAGRYLYHPALTAVGTIVLPSLHGFKLALCRVEVDITVFDWPQVFRSDSIDKFIPIFILQFRN